MLAENVIKPILTSERLAALRQGLDKIAVSEEIVRYIVAIARRTREHNAVKIGAGPRGTQSLALTSRVRAVIDGRDHVTQEDVQRMAYGCLEHRLVLEPEFVEDGLTCTEVVRHILQSVRPPRANTGRQPRVPINADS